MDIRTKRNNMKVIILSKSNYKEKDCIYNALTQEGVISFMAKGAQDPKSKFVWLNNPLTVADVDFLADGRYKHKVIDSAVLVSSPMLKATDYDYLVAISVLTELTKNVLADEEKSLLFEEVDSALNALRSGKEHLMVILVYLAKLIKLGGAELEVDHCVFCGSKQNIVAFSFEDGGFICKNCINEETVFDLKGPQLLLIRYIFKAKDYSLPEIDKYTSDDKKIILLKLKEFVDEYMGVKLNSIDTLVKNQ